MKVFEKKSYKENGAEVKEYKFMGIALLHKKKFPNGKKWYLLGADKNKLKGKSKKTAEYGKWVENVKTNKTLFVPMTTSPYKRRKEDVKIFAYYLAQFHSIPENDDTHGKGFTEWNNVASTVPAFTGHYQPKVPYDVGYYNLLVPGVMERQVEIAKSYGIYGFCFYYYWFNGKKVLDKPLRYFLDSKIDFHFHFFWANETWSSRWQGGNKEIILEQKYDSAKFEQFFYDILPFLKDDRYEKIDNKPILIVYHPDDMGQELFVQFVDTLNKLAIENGFNGMYLTTVFGFNKDKNFLQQYKLNGLTEFFPCSLQNKLKIKPVEPICSNMKISVYDLKQFIKNKEYLYDTDYDLYKCAFPDWDNSPRKLFSSADLYVLDDKDFKKWLKGIIRWTLTNNTRDKQYVYINAWNEWGEGAVLEPTSRYGYKYLQIIKDVLEKK